MHAQDDALPQQVADGHPCLANTPLVVTNSNTFP